VGADLLVPPMSLILEDTEWSRSQLVQHERPRFQGYSNAGCRFLFYTLLFLMFLPILVVRCCDSTPVINVKLYHFSVGHDVVIPKSEFDIVYRC
jgi:hypothetical protein